MSRKPTFTDDDKPKLIRTYEESLNMEIAGAALGITGRTLRNYFKKWGYTPERGPRHGRSGLDYHSSCIIEWIRRHPGVAIPTSVKGISTLTGCSYDSVRCYLYRYRREIREAILGLPDLRKYTATIKTIANISIPMNAIDYYKISIHTRSSKIKIAGVLVNGRPFVSYLTLGELKEKIDGNS